MLLYVERTDEQTRKPGGRRTALVDTASLDANVELERLVDHRQDGVVESSMLSIEYDSPSWKGLKAGSWYNVPNRVLRAFDYARLSPDDPGSLFQRGRLHGPSKEIDFTRFLAKQRNELLPGAAPSATLNIGDNVELHVLDCGQGNWNEVRSPTLRLIYDIGASQQFTRAAVETLVRKHSLAGESRDVHVVISHWDVDHYQALLGCTAADLAAISSVIAPSQLPATSTFHRVKKMLDAAKVSFASVPPATRPGHSREIVLVEDARVGPFQFYRAVPGRSRNQTGIVLTVEGTSRVGILTGDHHYQKVLAAISPQLLLDRAVLVAPHHGGHAGSLDPSGWAGRFSDIEVAISGGANSHGHPFHSILALLGQAPFVQPIHRTELDGDRVYVL